LEFNVSGGRVLATSLAIKQNFSTNIEARYLLQCLTDYAQSKAFRPKAFIPEKEFLLYFQKKTE
jgi:hypothetical protein